MHQRAVLAGGCFWGMQDLIRKLPGVVSTRVGYTGGDTPNATYRNHGTHAEGIEIVFDTAETSYRRILEYFFQIHHPTTRNRQGGDIGSSYRSAISGKPSRSTRTIWSAIRTATPVTSLVPTGSFPSGRPLASPRQLPEIAPRLHQWCTST